MKNVLLILALFMIASCGQPRKKEIQQYDGTYKTDTAKGCLIVLIITSHPDGYHYKIKTSLREQEGYLAVTKSEDAVYLTFTGLLGTEPKDEIEGQYIDDKIVIQNYGSSMNQYLNFSECDIKYLELIPSK
ncbi:MAG TPA: hypothetical protein VIK55_08485 [Paludibacter sp.]